LHFTTSQHHNITTSQHHNITTSQHHNITTSQHHNITQDGRIGIYDPEQRKARIELFHSKRAARIWRKRIKYDCRKKLADSRPRIKGRFVKRSDMNLPPEEIQRIYGGQLPKNVKVTITLPKNGLTPPPPPAEKKTPKKISSSESAKKKQQRLAQQKAKETKEAALSLKLKQQRMEQRRLEQQQRLQEQHDTMYSYGAVVAEEAYVDRHDDGLLGAEDGYGLQDFGVPSDPNGGFFFQD